MHLNFPFYVHYTLIEYVLEVLSIYTFIPNDNSIIYHHFDRDCNNETYLSYLLSALNNFSVHFAADSRGQLCILGEDLIPALLPLWNKTSTLVKVCLFLSDCI